MAVSYLVALLYNHRDNASLRRELESKIDGLDRESHTKTDALETKLSARAEALDARLVNRIDTLETKLNAKLDAAEANLRAEIRQVSFDLRLSLERVSAAEPTVKSREDQLTESVLERFRQLQETQKKLRLGMPELVEPEPPASVPEKSK